MFSIPLFIGGPLVTRIDHKGKLFTDQVQKRKVISIIQTATHRIRGVIFYDSDSRLKDNLNDTSENFIAVADAELLCETGQVAQRVPFIALNKAHIVWVIPANEAGGE
jgi:hypothetical protein